MTLTEIIATVAAMASKYGVEVVDLSDNPKKECATLRLEYRKNNRYIGGYSLIGAAEHPEYFDGSDLKSIQEQLKYVSKRKTA